MRLTDTSDKAVLALLESLKATNDPAEIRELSDDLERAIFPFRGEAPSSGGEVECGRIIEKRTVE